VFVTFTWRNALSVKDIDDSGDEYDVKFNKSVAMRIGNRYNKMCEACVLSGNNLKFV